MQREEGEMIYCIHCGAAVAPKALILKVEDKLRERDPKITHMLRLCPMCKAKSIVGNPSAAFFKT